MVKPRVSTAGSAGSIPDRGTKILHATWCSQRRKKEIGRESKEKDKKKNGDKAALLPSKLWIHCPSLDTAAKG